MLMRCGWNSLHVVPRLIGILRPVFIKSHKAVATHLTRKVCHWPFKSILLFSRMGGEINTKGTWRHIQGALTNRPAITMHPEYQSRKLSDRWCLCSYCTIVTDVDTWTRFIIIIIIIIILFFFCSFFVVSELDCVVHLCCLLDPNLTLNYRLILINLLFLLLLLLLHY